MRPAAVAGLLAQSGASWTVVERLLEEGRLVEVRYGSQCYYVRRSTGDRRAGADQET